MRWLHSIVLTACAGAQSPAMQRSTADVDHDGVPDVEDRCAYEPGPPPSGCPEPTAPVSRESVIEQTQTDAAPAAGDRVDDATPAVPACRGARAEAGTGAGTCPD